MSDKSRFCFGSQHMRRSLNKAGTSNKHANFSPGLYSAATRLCLGRVWMPTRFPSEVLGVNGTTLHLIWRFREPHRAHVLPLKDSKSRSFRAIWWN